MGVDLAYHRRVGVGAKHPIAGVGNDDSSNVKRTKKIALAEYRFINRYPGLLPKSDNTVPGAEGLYPRGHLEALSRTSW